MSYKNSVYNKSYKYTIFMETRLDKSTELGWISNYMR
jgi:hypothetical protein